MMNFVWACYCTPSSPLASGSQGKFANCPLLRISTGPLWDNSIPDEPGRGPQRCGRVWGNCAAGLRCYSCLFWGDGGQESAEWAGSKQFVWLWVLSLRDRIFVWPLFVQVCPGSNSESRKKRVPYNMTDGQHFVSPRVQTILSHSKTVETHYDMPVVPLWGCFMPSGVRRQLRPRPCWKAVRIWKRLGVGMGSACHMQGTPRLQKIEMW